MEEKCKNIVRNIIYKKRICKAHVFVHYHRVHTFTYFKMGGLKELPVFNLIY